MTVVSDDFDRANNESLGSNWSEDVENWRIQTNQLEAYDALATWGDAANKHGCARWVGTALASADNYVICDVAMTANFDACGPFVRKAAGTGAANSDCYSIASYRADAFYLMEQTNGNESVLGSWGTPGATQTGVEIQAEGSTIRMIIAGTQRASVTDSTYATGSVGVWGNSWGSGTTPFQANNWGAGDLGAGPATVVQDVIMRGVIVRAR